MPRLPIASAAVLAFACSVSAAPYTLEPLFLPGDVIDGLGGTFSHTANGSRINNHGQWVVEAIQTVNGVSTERAAVAYNGIHASGFIPFDFGDGITLSNTISNSVAINNHGQVLTHVRGLVTNEFGTPQARSVIFIDGQPVVRSGENSPLIGRPYTQRSINRGRPILNDAGHVLSNFDLETNVFHPVDIAVEFIPDGIGNYDQVLRMRGGMPLMSGDGVISPTYAPYAGAYGQNNYGDIIFAAAVNLPDPPSTGAILLNGEIVRQSGDLTDFANGHILVYSSQAAIDESQDYAYFGAVQSSEWDGLRLAVMRNESDVVWIDDGIDPVLAGYTVTNPSLPSISITDDVFWAASLTDTIGITYKGLFRNNKLIVTSDPNIMDVLHLPAFTYSVSDNGQWMILDSPTGIFRMQIPSPGTTAMLTAGFLASLRRRR